MFCRFLSSSLYAPRPCNCGFEQDAICFSLQYLGVYMSRVLCVHKYQTGLQFVYCGLAITNVG